jgi:hypothetical protein
MASTATVHPGVVQALLEKKECSKKHVIIGNIIKYQHQIHPVLILSVKVRVSFESDLK